MLIRISRRSARGVGTLIVAMGLSAGLASCAAASAPAPVTNPPTMAPEQSVSEACAVSRAEVDAITKDVKDRIDQASKAVAAGETPDFTGVFEAVSGALDRVSESVTNPEVLAALQRVQAEVLKLGEAKAPGSLLETPKYLSQVTGQLAKVQSAGESLQRLCQGS